MFGDISAWFYKALAGINLIRPRPASSTIIIKPHVVGDLTSARAEYDSIRGRIVSDWRVVDGEFRLDLTIPANTTATVSLPIRDVAQVREGGRPVDRALGVRFIQVEGRRPVFEVTSGAYRFTGPLDREEHETRASQANPSKAYDFSAVIDRIQGWVDRGYYPGTATLRQLLSHTSGYPDYQPKNRHPDDYQTLTEAVSHLVDLPPAFEPGEQFQYGGLAMMVRRVVKLSRD